MRLSPKKLQVLRDCAREALPGDITYELRLFGSRLDDNRKGGDVDIYLETTGLSAEQCYELKLTLRPLLEEALDLPVDLIVQDAQSPLLLISHVARDEGVSILRHSI